MLTSDVVKRQKDSERNTQVWGTLAPNSAIDGSMISTMRKSWGYDIIFLSVMNFPSRVRAVELGQTRPFKIYPFPAQEDRN